MFAYWPLNSILFISSQDSTQPRPSHRKAFTPGHSPHCRNRAHHQTCASCKFLKSNLQTVTDRGHKVSNWIRIASILTECRRMRSSCYDVGQCQTAQVSLTPGGSQFVCKMYLEYQRTKNGLRQAQIELTFSPMALMPLSGETSSKVSPLGLRHGANGR